MSVTKACLIFTLPAGRKSYESLPFAFGGSVTASYTYTAEGRLNSVTGFGAGTFGYDSAGDLTTYTATINGSGTTTSGVLAYDSGGRLTTRYAADGITPLETYGFDMADGWRTSQKRSADSTAVSYGYDSGGHLTSYTKPASSQGTTYAVSATYAYDALGQRSQSVVTTGSLTTTTTWVYDGIQLDALSATRSDGATWSVTYLYDEAGRPFAGVYRSSTSSPTEFGIVTTDRGDVAELTDASGAVFASYRYDAWGRALSSTTATDGSIPAADIATRQVLRYAGCCFDSESGLYYLSARSYDPNTMQFLQKDPAMADGEESAYQYCGGDPVGRVDPSGQWWSGLRIRWTKHAAVEWDNFTNVMDGLWAIEGELVGMLSNWRLGTGVAAAGVEIDHHISQLYGFKDLPDHAASGDLWNVEAADYCYRVAGSRDRGHLKWFQVDYRILCYTAGHWFDTAYFSANIWATPVASRGAQGRVSWDSLPTKPWNYRYPSDRWIYNVWDI